MTGKHVPLLRAASAAIPIAILLAAHAAPVAAQTPAGAQPSSPKLEEVVVTGSLVRREDIITPSPVTVISAQDIENSGLTTVADVVRSISADNSGTIPTAFGLGFAAGSAGVALRGLTVNSTLVLINGRRATSYPLADDGQRSFVDLNTMPLSAVDRVEVLRDGASSLYGADAIAGVVNIILRETFQGATTDAEVGFSERGGGGSRRVSGLFGTGDIKSDRYNAFVDFEYQKDDRIAVARRPFPFNSNDLSSIGGANLIAGQPAQFTGSTFGSVTPATLGTPGDLTTGIPVPGAVSQPLRACGAGSTQTTDASGNVYCAQNLLANTDDAPQEERVGVLAKLTVGVTDNAQAYVTGSFFQNTVVVDNQTRQIEYSTPHNTNTIALPPRLSNGSLNPNDPFAAAGEYALINYAFGDLGTRQIERNRVMRLVAGLKGQLGAWDYDTALVVNHAALETTLPGFPSFSGLMSAIPNGTYSFVNPSSNTAAARALVSPTALKTSTTDMDSIDLRVSRDLFQLPGGEALKLGLGAEGRYESQFDPDLNANLDILGYGVSQTEGSRQVYAAYAELDAPIIKQLEVDISGRYDRYGDFGGKFVPKAGFKFTPVPQLTLRGTYSEGFRAPSFAENGSSSAEGFVNYTPPASFAALHAANPGYVAQYSLASFSVANPNIKPETSDSYTFGLIFQPLRQVSLSADYYYIKKRDVIAPGDSAPALDAYYAGQTLPPGYSITPDAPDPSAPAALPRPAVVASPYVNKTSLTTDGLDLGARVNFDLTPGVRLTSDAEITKIFSWKFIGADGSSLQYVGTEGPYILSSGAGTPRYRGKWTNSVVAGPATVSAIAYYVSGFYMFGPDAAPGCLYTDPSGNPLPANCHVASFLDIDLTGEYRFGDHLLVSGAVENVANRLPPFNPANYAGVNYNPTYAQSGIIGRFFRVGMSYKF
jgi:iron complex outermembrane receptor protein